MCRKHNLRHTKPYICKYIGCSRVGGFSTSNDLERHIKSKHPSAVLGSEATKRYRCHVQGCKSKDKSWPRLDNFRSHLKRMHESSFVDADEFEDMVRRSVSKFDNAFYYTPCLKLICSRAEYTEPKLRPANQENGSDQTESLRRHSKAEPTISNRPQFDPGKSALRETHVVTNLNENVDHSQGGALKSQPVTKYSPVVPETSRPLTNLDISVGLHDNQSACKSEMSVPEGFNDIVPDIADKAFGSAARAAAPGLLSDTDIRHASALDAITEAIKAALIGDNAPVQSNTNTLNDNLEWDLSRRVLPAEPTCQPPPDSAVPRSGANITPGGSPSRSESYTNTEAQRKAVELLQTLRRFGYTVQQETTAAEQPLNPGSIASSKSENLVTCSKCKRFKGRPCELKLVLFSLSESSTLTTGRKHMKRHSRPYGCTFSACKNKTFGSKNDWKRHENSQHFHLESWRCDEKKSDGGVCAKVCYRKQTFTDHLQRDHSISNGNGDLAAKLHSCHIGRNCQARFWCGFCVKLIDLKKKSVDAWAERFDHIDDHFMGRHGLTAQSIQEWVPVDGDRPKQDISSPLEIHSITSHGDGEESTQSPGSLPGAAENSSADIAGPSSITSLLEPLEGLKRKRAVDDDEGRLENQRSKSSTGGSLVYCVRP